MIGRFALAWDEFQAKMAERFKTLLHGGEFSDVTLVAKDSTCLKVHKVILASGSGFFKDIMSQMENHPNAQCVPSLQDFTQVCCSSSVQNRCTKAAACDQELDYTGTPKEA